MLSSVKSFDQLPDAIRYLRGDRSRAEFASTWGVTRQAVEQWESGQTSPRPATLAAMGISAEYIVVSSKANQSHPGE